MTIYYVPGDPATPLKINSLRIRARRRGYWIGHDRAADYWSLVDARLKRPLVGFNGVGLAEIARVILTMSAPRPTRHKRVRRHRRPVKDIRSMLKQLQVGITANGS
jgi:hypothetical protein